MEGYGPIFYCVTADVYSYFFIRFSCGFVEFII